MQTKRVFSKLAQKTHMPFYSDGTLLFCLNDKPIRHKADKKVRQFLHKENLEVAYRPWKLARAEWASKKIHKINCPMPAEAILCNPTFYEENGILNVSFIAGIQNNGINQYHLYQMTGDSWDSLSQPQIVGRGPARTGFVNSRFFCLGSTRDLMLLDRQKHERFRLTTSLQEISRAIYDPENPTRLLITGRNQSNEYLTLLFNTETKEVQEIRGPAPCYKACLVGNRIVFSYRESEELEDYQIHVAPAIFNPTSETVQMVQG